jgi:hypothetical protein
MLGGATAPVALAFAVLDLTGSTSDLGIVLAARQIPVVLLRTSLPQDVAA